MLILLLFIAIALYVGLYFAWDFLAGHLDRPTAWLYSLQRMVFMPEPLIFRLLWLLIIIVMAYLAADFLINTLKRAAKKKAPPEEMKLKTTTLPSERTQR